MRGVKTIRPPTARFVVKTLLPSGWLWIQVECPNLCHQGNSVGAYLSAHGRYWPAQQRCGRMRTCLLCREKANELTALLDNEDFAGLLSYARTHNWYAAVTDWLGDNGHFEIQDALCKPR